MGIGRLVFGAGAVVAASCRCVGLVERSGRRDFAGAGGAEGNFGAMIIEEGDGGGGPLGASIAGAAKVGAWICPSLISPTLWVEEIVMSVRIVRALRRWVLYILISLGLRRIEIFPRREGCLLW